MTDRIVPASLFLSCLGMAAVLAMHTGAAHADPYQQQPPMAEEAQPSETKLLQFVAALEEVTAIREKAVTRLAAAIDEEEALQVREQAQDRMAQAVRSQGLTIEEYNRIAGLMGTEPELRERVRNKLEESS